MEVTEKPISSFASKRKVSTLVTYNESRGEMYLPAEPKRERHKIRRAASLGKIVPVSEAKEIIASINRPKLQFTDNHGTFKPNDSDSQTTQKRKSVLTYNAFKPIPNSFNAEKTIFDKEIDFDDLMALTPDFNLDTLTLEDELMTDQQYEIETRLVRERRSEQSYIKKSMFSRFFSSTLFSSGLFAPQSEPTKILPNMYIGSYNDRCDGRNLIALGITHILNMTNSQWDEEKNCEFICKSIPIVDDTNQLLSRQILMSILVFLNHVNQVKGKVLIHCKCGASRAPMALMFYLMVMRDVSIADGIMFMHQLRPCVNLNRGFLFQLGLMEIKLTNSSSVIAKQKGVIDDAYNYYEWNRIKVFKPKIRDTVGLFAMYNKLR